MPLEKNSDVKSFPQDFFKNSLQKKCFRYFVSHVNDCFRCIFLKFGSKKTSGRGVEFGSNRKFLTSNRKWAIICFAS